MRVRENEDFKAIIKAVRESAPKPPPSPTAAILAEAARKRAQRRALSEQFEALRLYEPQPQAEAVHCTNTLWRAIDGSNKSGKTLCVLAEAGWALTGTHPLGFYPKKNGVAMFVGLKWTHISQIYLGLFEQGLFKVIQDERTRLWRSVRYDRDNPTQLQAYDIAYREKWRDAPPLIPKRWIKGRIAWEASAKDAPSCIHIVNGWTAYFYSALGSPEQGRHYNFVDFDEEMPNPEFYEEAHRGLIRIHETFVERPKGLWPATSQVANPELAALREKAAADPNSKLVRHFNFLITKNPYIEQDARDDFREGLSEDSRKTRFEGIPATAWRRVYPMFDPRIHCCDQMDIPDDWVRYFYADPGRQHNVTIFIAVDPNERHMVVYDGFDIPGGAEEWANEVAARQGNYCFELGVFDMQAGTQKPMGESNLSVSAQYFNAAVRAGVQVRCHGPLDGFFPSCNNVESREKALVSAMRVRTDGPHEGTPKLQIMAGKFPQLESQIKSAHTDPERPDKRYKNVRIPQDWIDCLEYAAAHNPPYHPPEPLEQSDHVLRPRTAWDVFEETQRHRSRAKRRYATRY